MPFLGTKIAIASVDIRGSGEHGATVSFTVAFLDEAGRRHAESRHKLALGADPVISDAARALIESLANYSSLQHFGHPVTTEGQKESIDGIAEAIRAPPDPSDRVAEQG